jgi:hypothetical protein
VCQRYGETSTGQTLPNTPHFSPEDGSNMFLSNVGMQPKSIRRNNKENHCLVYVHIAVKTSNRASLLGLYIFHPFNILNQSRKHQIAIYFLRHHAASNMCHCNTRKVAVRLIEKHSLNLGTSFHPASPTEPSINPLIYLPMCPPPSISLYDSLIMEPMVKIL